MERRRLVSDRRIDRSSSTTKTTGEGSAIYASPVSYEVQGRQYIAIASGAALITFALPDEGSTIPAARASRK